LLDHLSEVGRFVVCIAQTFRFVSEDESDHGMDPVFGYLIFMRGAIGHLITSEVQERGRCGVARSAD
jgi:hypothetical protein